MKTKTVNGILCGYIKLLPYKEGWIGVDDEADYGSGELVFSPIHKVIEESIFPELSKISGYYKIICATPALGIPFERLPEIENIETLARDYATGLMGQKYESMNHGDQVMFNTIVRTAKHFYHYHAASHPYTGKDLENLLNYICESDVIVKDGNEWQVHDKNKITRTTSKEILNNFLSTLHPKGIWAEVSKSDNADSMYYFKAPFNILEWES